MLKKELLNVLACPKCKGKLDYKKTFLLCKKCSLKYNVIDDMPDMLIDHAERV